MNFGMGDSTAVVTRAPATIGGAPALTSFELYTAGLKLWLNPGQAFGALGQTIKSPGTAFSGDALPLALGLWTPPIVITVIVLGMMARRGR